MSQIPKLFSGQDDPTETEVETRAIIEKLWEGTKPMLAPVQQRPEPRPAASVMPSMSKFAQGALEKLVVGPPQVEEPVEEEEPDATEFVEEVYEPEERPAAGPEVDEKPMGDRFRADEAGTSFGVLPVRPTEPKDFVVDALFERVESILAEKLDQMASRAEASASAVDSRVKDSITRFVRSELPGVIRSELGGLLREEVDRSVSSVSGGLMTESTKGLSKLNTNLSKLVDKLDSMERRIQLMEGSNREIVVKLPKGLVNVTAPITIPEREVKIMAPVTVEPPKVVFDKGAIGVTFQKNGDKVERKIDFERDKDNCIKSAKIVDVGKKNVGSKSK